LCIGTLTLIISLTSFLNLKKISKEGMEADAIVYDFEQNAHGSVSIFYPVVRFMTQQKEWITRASKIASFPGALKRETRYCSISKNQPW
jgi:hypothetical protein